MEIALKIAICNIFTKIKFITGVLQRGRLDFKQGNVDKTFRASLADFGH